MTPQEIEFKLLKLNYQDAITWCINNLGAEREPEGHNAIARLKVKDPVINAIQFYNYYPLAGNIHFNYNN